MSLKRKTHREHQAGTDGQMDFKSLVDQGSPWPPAVAWNFPQTGLDGVQDMYPKRWHLGMLNILS